VLQTSYAAVWAAARTSIACSSQVPVCLLASLYAGPAHHICATETPVCEHPNVTSRLSQAFAAAEALHLQSHQGLEQSAGPAAGVLTMHQGEVETEEAVLKAMRAASNAASRALIAEHLREFRQRNPDATFVSWIASLHPENVQLDNRMSIPGNDWSEARQLL